MKFSQGIIVTHTLCHGVLSLFQTDSSSLRSFCSSAPYPVQKVYSAEHEYEEKNAKDKFEVLKEGINTNNGVYTIIQRKPIKLLNKVLTKARDVF